MSVQWTDMRELSAALMIVEHKLQTRQDNENEESAELAKAVQRIEEADLVPIRDKITYYSSRLKESSKTETVEKVSKYEKKLKKWEDKFRQIREAELSDLEAALESTRAKKAKEELERSALLAEIRGMLERFSCTKFVTVLGVEDFTLISMYRDLEKVGKKLTFTLGASLRIKKAGALATFFGEIGLDGFLARVRAGNMPYCELNDDGFRILSDEEKSSLLGIASPGSGSGSGSGSSKKKGRGSGKGK